MQLEVFVKSEENEMRLNSFWALFIYKKGRYEIVLHAYKRFSSLLLRHCYFIS
jgi:hypothetical protein